MKGIEHFVPGVPSEQEAMVSHMRWPLPAGVAEAYVATYTEPGERVLVPYCQGPAMVREIVAAGRQVLAVNFDPLLALLVRTELAPPPAREMDAAVARLGDSLKQGVPLRRYLTDLYATTCPACLRPAMADYYVWDRERGQPIARYLHCPACGWDGQAAMEPEDWERLEQVPAREMHYHYVLDRVAPPPQEVAQQARLESLLALYSPRNLYALAELTRKIEGLFPDGPLHGALKILLLDCLDRCSFLAPLPGSTVRRRGLGRPGRFLERNVWCAFEEAVVRLQAAVDQPVTGLANTLAAFLASDGEWAGFVGQGLVRDLARAVQSGSLGLILTSPPPLDSAAWSLSYLWGAWLLGAETVAPLRPLLRQRTPDPAWYARVMAGSLAALAGLLRDEGRLVLVLTDQRPAMVEALVLAASQARLGVVSLVQCGSDYRLELSPAVAASQPVPLAREALEGQIRRVAVETAVDTIRARGEPVPWPTVHANIQRRLAEAGLLAQSAAPEGPGSFPLDLVAEQVEAALADPAFVRLAAGKPHQELWWLADPGDLAPALCDRVEMAAYQLLRDSPALVEVDLATRVYARFPGPLTPDPELVATCLRTYGTQPAPGYWQLRAEDRPEARYTEWQTIIDQLLDLGRRLGYRAEVWAPFDVAWFGEEGAQAVFVVHWQAVVSEALALSDQVARARPYVVIPGGRAALVSYKLAHNPVWQQVVDEGGWWFIKYRHVRELVSQPDVDEYALRTIVRLDPIVEREMTQLSLF